MFTDIPVAAAADIVCCGNLDLTHCFAIQDYDAMVSLVEDMDAVPNLRVTNTVAIQNLFAFALNRRNLHGDRDKALSVIHKVFVFFFVTSAVDVVINSY